MGISALHQALKNLCLNTDWNYAVFWKLNPQPQMLLTFEDAYYEKSDPSNDLLGLAVAKMSYQRYYLGEGLVGQVAVTYKHLWISGDQLVNDPYSFEDYDGLKTQFATGIRTIAVVGVVPHGVVQLGSFNNIPEDLKMVNHIQEIFLELQSSYNNTITSINYGISTSYPISNLDQNAGLSMPISSNVQILNENIESKSEIDTMDALQRSSKFPAGFELYEALGPTFYKQNDNYNWQNVNDMPGTSSNNLVTTNTGPEDLLEAVVANACQNDTEFGKSVKWVEPRYDDMQTSGSGCYSFESSLGFSSASHSRCGGSLEMSQERANATKKRAKPGESNKPRPRDRQLIQDRIKELRELVPNGSKCSIDSLLERTIKHMLFMQGVTKHADKIDKYVDLKVWLKKVLVLVRLYGNKTGIQGPSVHEQGSSWVMEVGNSMDVCPVTVENIGTNGQMLVEMMCEGVHFLEIADAIRSLGLDILKGVTEPDGDKTRMCFVVEDVTVSTQWVRAMLGMAMGSDLSFKLIRKRESYQWSVYNVLNRYQSQWSKVEKVETPNTKDEKESSASPTIPQPGTKKESNPGVNKYNSDEDDAVNNNKWKPELAWLTKALEPALQLWKWPPQTGNAQGNDIQPSSRSLAEILASIQKSKLGVQEWSLSDLTIGLYLVYLQQASKNPFEDVKGVKISNDTVVQDLIYHVELAKGSYRDSAAALAKHSMLRESNIVKFVKNSSLLRPGYYIGVDTRNKLVIFGIRGTHTVTDLITDIVSSSDVEVNFEGYSTHFGTAEAARWFLTHELGTIKKYLEKHELFGNKTGIQGSSVHEQGSSWVMEVGNSMDVCPVTVENIDLSFKLIRKRESYQWSVYNVLNRYQSQWSKVEKVETPNTKDEKESSASPTIPQPGTKKESNPGVNKYNSDEDDAVNNSKWKPELAWLTKALEPALQLWKWPPQTGNAQGNDIQPSSRSLAEILASIQKSKLGVQEWSLSDLTIGLYLVYLQQASKNPFEDVKGVKISNDTVVQDLIYHVELAKGSYRDSAASLAKHSMLRESNIGKFVKNSSLLRPGYYIGVDTRNKLVIFGIRGTHTVTDLITDIVSSSDVEVNFEGYSTHFGTAEAARWFLTHELGTIKKYLEKHEGFRLRLVGHSLGGAIASMLAIMIRKKTSEELGFSPEIVTAVGYGTPPCVSRELAECCHDYVTTVCMQDDIIPRLSVATLVRLRNEILRTDWKTIFEKEDWRSVLDLVTNAKQVMSSVQDVAKKLVDYTKFGSQKTFIDVPGRKDSIAVQNSIPTTSIPEASKSDAIKTERHDSKSPHDELFIPGTVYFLKRKEEKHNGIKVNKFTLWKRHTGEHFQRILLSNNLIADHKCDSHYYALRDVLKGIPGPRN
ncbi:hypothetical protein SSX86_022213 [Deinandra increscens subsp. villosa]|uniref:BHLH domain-containing protein n=1 Tax=Deinandra increscens subsp. villosa TaxID=3103831 RepID=A0AAP0CLZ7_9ASTR